MTTLAIGDPDSFQVERHDDKVFVKPLQPGVSTNLFVWTATRELSYELDPAGQLAAMDVLVRAEPAPKPHTSALASAEPSDAEIRKIASLVLTQAMMGSEDIAHDSVKPAPNRVEVSLEQVFRAKDRIYIRYSVANQTDAPFRVTTPDVCASAPDRAARLARESEESPIGCRRPSPLSKQNPVLALAVMQAGISPSRSFTWGEDNRRHQH